MLAKYPENWIEFINRELDAEYTLDDFIFGAIQFPDIPRKAYYELKHRFRDLGKESRYVQVFPDAWNFTNTMRERGYKIIILSARPYQKYKRMQSDTVSWMHGFGLAYDAFIWDTEKHTRILSTVPGMEFMVEDSLDIANQVAALGYQVFLRDRPYNQGETHEKVSRVSGLEEILDRW